MKYFTINHWKEYEVDGVSNYDYAKQIFMFIEEAIQGYSSCLIASVSNKCNTVVCALLYLMMKYKWNLHRSLEYLNGRKADIEVTKNILKQLRELESKILQNLHDHDENANLRANW